MGEINTNVLPPVWDISVLKIVQHHRSMEREIYVSKGVEARVEVYSTE